MNLLKVVLQQYGVDTSKLDIVQFSTSEVADAIKDHKVEVFLAAGPVNSKITADAIAASSRDGAPTFLAIDSAEAIAQNHAAYEFADIPAGAFGGSPPRPDDEVKTISFSHLIVARKSLSEPTVAAFTRQLFAIRQSLMTDFPLAAKIETPDTRRDHHRGFLEDPLGERGRGVAVRHGSPDVDRALWGLHLDADVAQGVHHQVAAPLVDSAHLFDLLARPSQGRGPRELHRLEEPGVDVGLQPPVRLDRLGVAEDRGAAPTGHVVALGEREDLDPDLLRSGCCQETRRDVAVVGDLGVGVVVDDEDLVTPGELHDPLEEARRARPLRWGCSGS